MLNQLMAGSSVKPEVGMGVTRLSYTDRSPYTIITVISEKEIIIQEDDARRIDQNGMSESQQYEFTPNPEGYTLTLTLRRSGRWIEKGCSDTKGATAYLVGQRMKYHDYSF